MTEYHKIDTVYQRDPETKHKSLIIGAWSKPAFGYLAKNEWVFTEKVDGTNIRIIITPPEPRCFVTGAIEFCGKTDNASLPAPLVKRLEERFLPQRDALFEVFQNGGCLYGEGYGAKIQSGGKYRPDQDFVLFDVTACGWWLERHNVEDVAGKFGLDVVPVVGRGNLHEMLEIARHGFSSKWGNFTAEGIVARPSTELCDRAGRRIITKIKHRDFAIAATTE